MVYVFEIFSADNVPMTRSDALLFTGELLYYFYNWCLISAFLLKVKNPTKDVLRLFHKPSQKDLKGHSDTDNLLWCQ
jgi:hypothetical protein